MSWLLCLPSSSETLPSSSGTLPSSSGTQPTCSTPLSGHRRHLRLCTHVWFCPTSPRAGARSKAALHSRGPALLICDRLSIDGARRPRKQEGRSLQRGAGAPKPTAQTQTLALPQPLGELRQTMILSGALFHHPENRANTSLHLRGLLSESHRMPGPQISRQ